MIMKADIYGSFSPDCDILIAGWYEGGVVLEDVIDNSFSTRYEALQSIKYWAIRVGAEIEEITFD